MANLAEVSQWENVIRQIENGEAATGGADGLANVQAKQLANRTKYLKDNYLPLAGGILKGALLHKNGGWFNIVGGEASNNSASLQLASSDADGRFNLSANNGSDNIALRGYTNGVLTWGDNDLAGSAIVAKSLSANGYIKYASGLIIQWGTVSFADATDKKIVSPVYYPIEFPNYVLSMCAMSTTGDIDQDFTSYITGTTKSNFGVGIRGTFVSGKNVSIGWLAIGY